MISRTLTMTAKDVREGDILPPQPATADTVGRDGFTVRSVKDNGRVRMLGDAAGVFGNALELGVHTAVTVERPLLAGDAPQRGCKITHGLTGDVAIVDHVDPHESGTWVVLDRPFAAEIGGPQLRGWMLSTLLRETRGPAPTPAAR